MEKRKISHYKELYDEKHQKFFWYFLLILTVRYDSKYDSFEKHQTLKYHIINFWTAMKTIFGLYGNLSEPSTGHVLALLDMNNKKKLDIKKIFKLFYEPPRSLWGPIFWHVLHYTSFHKISHYYLPDLIDLFSVFLPCGECRSHFLKNLDDNPLPPQKEKYSIWSVSFHNIVNTQLGKPQMSYTMASKIYL